MDKPNIETPESAKKPGVHWSVWAVGVPLAAVAALMLIGAMTSPQKAALQEKERQIAAACAQLQADSAPGADRRTTRQVCDQMRRDLEAEKARTR